MEASAYSTKREVVRGVKSHNNLNKIVTKSITDISQVTLQTSPQPLIHAQITVKASKNPECLQIRLYRTAVHASKYPSPKIPDQHKAEQYRGKIGVTRGVEQRKI